MSTYIYSAKIICNGDSDGKTRNTNIGFYPDYSVPTNAPFIVWSESTLAESDDATTVINSTLARSYAPIITEMGDIETTFEIDNPVVQNSGVDFTIANQDKVVLLLQAESIVLAGLPIQISLNDFDSGTGVLISSEIKFHGVITAVNFSETELSISCESNKFNRKSQVLKEGEILTVGVSDADMHFALRKKEPSKTVLLPNYTFLLLGRRDTVFNLCVMHYYQLVTNVQLPADFATIIAGSFMEFMKSSSDSNGQFQNVVSITEISGTIASDYAEFYPANDPDTLEEIRIHWYYEVVLDGFYTSVLPANLSTFVQFVKIDHVYDIGKLPVSGTVDQLCIKNGDIFSPIQVDSTRSANTGIQYRLDNVIGEVFQEIRILHKYPKDEKTSVTYTVLPCNSLSLIPAHRLTAWQAIAADGTAYGQFYVFEQWNDNGWNYGLFHLPTISAGVTAHSFSVLSDAYDKNRNTYALYTHSFTCEGKSIVGLQYNLPEISTNATFKSCYLGVKITSECANYDETEPVKILALMSSGETKEIFSENLKQDGAGGAALSNVPWWYYDDDGVDVFLSSWQEVVPPPTSGLPVIITGLEKFKIKIETVAEYREIVKIGLFFPRKAASSSTLDKIKIYELCVIFEHENDLTEVYL